jgi:hypothetical protein
MKPITNLICLKTLYMSSLFVFCFFIGSPAWAQESEPQELDRAYCDSIELGHPDLERCEVFLEELAPIGESGECWECTETQTRWNAGSVIITGAAASAGAVGGLVIYVESSSCFIFCNAGLALLSLGGGGLVGGLVGRGISNLIWGYEGGDDTRTAQFYVAPYLHEDASGLTFSSRF